MKIQNLAVIFLIIAIPLTLILSYYVSLLQETMKLQIQYDEKLLTAAKTAIQAFETNTVEWNYEFSRLADSKRRDIRASINSFTTSLANGLGIGGTSKEYLLQYVPAIAYTLYDGYYIYTPTFEPVLLTSDKGVQLYYFEDAKEERNEQKISELEIQIINGQTSYGVLLYEADKNSKGLYDGKNYTYNRDDAKTTYMHVLKTFEKYSEEISKGNKNLAVNYTFDNYISVYGKIGSNIIEKEGFLTYFDSNTIIPKATINKEDGTISNVTKKITDCKYNETKIDEEILQEQVTYLDGEDNIISGKYYNYIYDIQNEKYYYDNETNSFFTISSNKRTDWPNGSDLPIVVGSYGCKYRSISIATSDTEYQKLYQVLNGVDFGKWYILNKNQYIEISNPEALGLNEIEIYEDVSAINYYVESYCFTNWAKSNLKGLVEENGEDVFDISKTNNPEEDETKSAFTEHKKKVMVKTLENDLNVSISMYNKMMNTYEFSLPKMKATEYEQIFSNVSFVAYFQGVPIGLKYYNNYAIATSTKNKEWVCPEEIYFSTTGDSYYHSFGCDKITGNNIIGYRSTEYIKRAISDKSNHQANYYLHGNMSNLECYYCLVNQNTRTIDDTVYTKAYYQALGREKYYQNESN